MCRFSDAGNDELSTRREGAPARGKWAIACQEQEQADGDACRKNNQGNCHRRRSADVDHRCGR
jgi:hypothetical protein